MNVLILVAEVAPFSHVGGLARGTYALAKALSVKGHDVRIATPLHKSVVDYVKENKKTYSEEKNLRITGKNTGMNHGSWLHIKILKRSPVNEYMYFIDIPDYFGLRSQVYGYADDYKRYYTFSRACAELLLFHKRAGGWLPDVIQCHDWHTGYFVELLKRVKRYTTLKYIPVVYTVHNFKYQNEIKFQYMDDAELDMGKSPLAPLESPELSRQNSLSRGMVFADAVNTVSPTHAKEIASDDYEFSYNLGRVITKIRPKLSGILNGLDYRDFDPQSDTHIGFRYSDINVIKNRAKNKKILRNIFSLPDHGDAPLLGYVGRMSSQKGLEFFFMAMRRILRETPLLQVIGIGDGEDYYCELFWRLRKEFPRQTGIKLVHDIHMPRMVFAGSDMIVVPSNYEPGGIVVLEAMRYGCIPIVRRTGGLNDMIVDYSLVTGRGNGFSYMQRDDRALYRAIMRALSVYRMREDRYRLIRNCMNYRNTWESAASEYEQLFRSVSKDYGKST